MSHPCTIRAFAPGDERGVVDCLGRSMTADAIPMGRFVRQVLLDPNFRAEGAPVAEVGGTIVGFALSIARQVPHENSPPDGDRGYITLFGVDHCHQRRGIGSALLAHAEAYLRSQGRKLCMIAPYAPGYFICGVDVNHYASGLAFFSKNGFVEVYRPIAMEVSLWSLVVPEWVGQKEAALVAAGVTIETFRPELTLPLLKFAADEFAGDWVRFARQGIDRIMQGEKVDRLIVAHAGGRALGFSHYEAERFGPIGVSIKERGRGIGQVLMYRTLAAQRDAGHRIAWFLWSDDKTAQKLYTAAGFREARRFALLRKNL